MDFVETLKGHTDVFMIDIRSKEMRVFIAVTFQFIFWTILTELEEITRDSFERGLFEEASQISDKTEYDPFWCKKVAVLPHLHLH